MNLDYLTGKKFAILAVSENKKGETEQAIFTGIARWADEHLFLDREEQKAFQVPDYALERINPVPSSVADIMLYAEFYTSLYIALLPENANPHDYIDTGLKWPK